jgi:hypothetical protein
MAAACDRLRADGVTFDDWMSGEGDEEPAKRVA